MPGLYGQPGAPAQRLVTLDRNIGAERVLSLPLSEWEEVASGIPTSCPTVMKVLAQVCFANFVFAFTIDLIGQPQVAVRKTRLPL